MENLFEILDEIDRSLFIFLNGFYHPTLDFVMFWASDRFIWIPFYAVLVFFIVKTFKSQGIFVLLSIAFLVVLTDQITSGLMKPLFERFRPCHDSELMAQIHLVGKCGGRYGFASSHAANSFGVATFIWLLFRNYFHLSWLMLLWATIVSYSRIYLGVHYPGDIMVGAAIGVLMGILMFFVLLWTAKTYLSDNQIFTISRKRSLKK